MNEPNLNVIVQDGRWALAHSRKTLFGHWRGCLPVALYPLEPDHAEFFQEARAHLTDDGVLVINVGRTFTDRRLIEAMAGTLESVFPSVYVADIPDTFNSILYATVQPTQAGNLAATWPCSAQMPIRCCAMPPRGRWPTLLPTPHSAWSSPTTWRRSSS